MVKNTLIAMRQLMRERQILVGVVLIPARADDLWRLRCITVSDQSEKLLA
jgi:hypothetical protein